MSFLSPLMLLGVLGAMIPVLVHLQGRRKAKTIHFAALDFLIGTDKRLAKRLVLRQIALLIFRVLICLIVPIVLAKPYTSCQSPGPEVTRGPQAVVLLIDNSASSAYRLDGRSLLTRSLSTARSLLEQLGPEAEVALVSTTDDQGELSRDHLSLREQLSEMQLSSEKADTATALQRSLQLLSGSSHQRKTIFVLAAPTRAVLPENLNTSSSEVSIRVINPAGKETDLHNLAITDLRVIADNSIGNRGATIVAEVHNFSSKTSTAKLSLRIGQNLVARGELEIAPGQKQQKRFSARLGDEPRTAEISVHLQGDNLRADDVRYVVADARDQVPVLLVNGDPRTVRHEDELYYLEAALRPGDRSESGTTITSTTPDALAELDLNDFDVILLANLSPLPTKIVSELSRWVRAGGGLFVAMGANVDPDAYNRTMAPLLAQSLRTRLDLKRGRKGTIEGQLRLSKLELEHPVFAVFGRDAPGLYNARFHQIMLLGPTTEVRDRKVLARYDNGAAALVQARKGSGLLLLFSSTLDRDWNDLAIHPGFLPFMQQSVRHLAAKPFQRQDKQILVGDSIALKVAPTDARLEIEGPGDARMVLEGEKLSGRKTARLDSVRTPGIYRVEAVDAKGAVQQRPEAAFAANLDPSISDLRLVATASLESEGSGAGASQGAQERRRRVELWHAIAAILLLLLLMEAGVSLYSGRAKTSSLAERPRIS